MVPNCWMVNGKSQSKMDELGVPPWIGRPNGGSPLSTHGFVSKWIGRNDH